MVRLEGRPQFGNVTQGDTFILVKEMILSLLVEKPELVSWELNLGNLAQFLPLCSPVCLSLLPLTNSFSFKLPAVSGLNLSG